MFVVAILRDGTDTIIATIIARDFFIASMVVKWWERVQHANRIELVVAAASRKGQGRSHVLHFPCSFQRGKGERTVTERHGYTTEIEICHGAKGFERSQMVTGDQALHEPPPANVEHGRVQPRNGSLHKRGGL